MAKTVKSRSKSATAGKGAKDSEIVDAVVVDEEPGQTTEQTPEKIEESSSAETAETALDDTPDTADNTATPPDAAGQDGPLEQSDSGPGRDAESGDMSTKTDTGDSSDSPKSDSPGSAMNENSPADDTGADQKTDDEISLDPETKAESSTPEKPAPRSDPERIVRETVVERKGGFAPMVLGGVVAAGLGFFGGQYVNQGWPFGGAAQEDPFRAEVSAALAAQGDQVAALGARIDGVQETVGGIDLSPLSGAIETQAAEIASLTAALPTLRDGLTALDDRLTTLEKRPVTEAVSPEAIAAYERELSALREEITTQRTEIETLAAEAVQAQQTADMQAELAQARAALAQVIAALDSGAGFAPALTEATTAASLPQPEALAAVAADGVLPMATLIESFPDAARAALDAARSAGAEAGEEGGGFGAFLRSQLGARSLTPREGSDPDAVLSRAEAAVRQGDLATALAEIEALPEAAQAALADWRAQAEARQAAVQAAAALAQELNKE